MFDRALSELRFRGHGGMVDATDLKSVDRKVVRVQVPLPPSLKKFSQPIDKSDTLLFTRCLCST